MSGAGSGNGGLYENVPNQDDEMDPLEDFEDEYDEEYHTSPSRLRNRDPRSHRQHRGPPASLNDNNKGMTYYLLYVLFALVVTSVALVGWKEANRRQKLQGILAPVDEDDAKNLADSLALSQHGLAGHKQQSVVHYDPSFPFHPANPFDLHPEDDHMSVVHPPLLPFYNNDDDNKQNDNQERRLGYMIQPNVFNDTLVFVAEGDLYLTTLGKKRTEPVAAMKLTTTVGNVRTPVLNPVYPHLIAFTATYTGRREAYLLDMRSGTSSATRLTYWDAPAGISSIVGWTDHGLTLIFAASSHDVGLPDVRLYQLKLQQNNGDGAAPAADGQQQFSSSSPLPQVWQIQPIPLAQARDGFLHQDCLYSVRFAQSSNTIRYVGGTAESLWAWCASQPRAIPLTTTFRGTDKSPRLYKSTPKSNKAYLLFLSDRMTKTSTTQASSMNLWAMPLPLEKDLYRSNDADTAAMAQEQRPLVQLTSVSCDYDGKALMEFAVDENNGNVVLRIGADLFLMTQKDIGAKLQLTAVAKDKHNKESNKVDGESNKKYDKKKSGGDRNRSLASSSERGDNNIQPLNIAVMSDFHENQERLIPVQLPGHATTVDVFQTAFGGTSALLGLRGQLYVTPVVDNVENIHRFTGAGMNLPLRRYRLAPGVAAGGSVRIQAAKYVPLFLEKKDARRLALILATDPKSETAEQGFYLLETQSDASQMFVDATEMPDPFLGGSKNGGSVADGGLGTVVADSVTVSPCGRRLAWADQDGRICTMTLPMYQNGTSSYSYKVLPQENEQGQPMVGTQADLSWSPGGRYLAIRHAARNQFDIISIADLGDPEEEGDVRLQRIVQATPDRFNSGHAYWGKTSLDFKLKKQQELLSQLVGKPIEWPGGATVLYFLSDRDLMSDVKSPWGTRQPSPHFPKRFDVYALPLVLDEDERGPLTTTRGTFGGGGASELWVDNILALEDFLEAAVEKGKTPTRHLLQTLDAATETKTTDPGNDDNESLVSQNDAAKTKQANQDDSAQAPTAEIKKSSPFPKDREIHFGTSSATNDLSFARRAYRLGNVPSGEYATVSQPLDDPSLMVIESVAGKSVIKVFSVDEFPSDSTEPMTVELGETIGLAAFSFTTTREHFVLFFSPGGVMKVVQNTASGLVSLIQDQKLTKNIADTGEMALSVWPALEYQQMYDDAWRLLRDYFYDPGMNGIDWPEVHARYRSLVKRCAKREDLDDVLKQMAAELSALHVFVYGGEYRQPLHDSKLLVFVHEPASLGATLMRAAEWKGYVVTAIPERDPDFNLVDGKPTYSPLSNRALQLSGQRGLEVGDVIVGVNGESVMRVPDIHMLLRGMSGRSVRLDVLRLTSGSTARSEETDDDANQKLGNETDTPEKNEMVVAPEPLITVPISLDDAAELRYGAWEWKTREAAKSMAQDAGFSVGYVHLRSMSGPQDIDAFFRNFFPDYNKEALIMDVRHNRGGSIDSWLLDILQRQAWMYWQSRTTNITTGGLGWDEHFAFRGHIVVLIDEHTSSDGEGFSRGMSELGLGKLIGKRTWGGGIWLSSDNHLVDGGIATAPEVGTYNDNFGWGLGIEQMGVEPDFEVDNDPRMSYDGSSDQQLEYAISYLKEWIAKEPIVLPKNPGPKRDMSIPKEAIESCHA